MTGLRNEAEALAVALELGACDVAEVLAWADAQILREDRPPAAILDVALARGRYPQDVAGLLRLVPGTPNGPDVGRLLVALLHDRLEREAGRAGSVASALFRLYVAERIADPGLNEVASWAWDALDLAEAGYTQDSREEIVRRMRDTLARAAADSPASWSIMPGADGP